MAYDSQGTAATTEKVDPCKPGDPPCEVVDEDAKLGELICDSTPYTKMYMPKGWQCEIEWDAAPGQWQFRGAGHRVAKALRIPVLVAVWNDKTCRHEYYKDWLLVGYEGGGGY